MRITDRLTMIESTVGQAYLWRDGDDLTLIDWERPIFAEVNPGVPPTPGCPVDRELTGGEVLAFGGGAGPIPRAAAGRTPGQRRR